MPRAFKGIRKAGPSPGVPPLIIDWELVDRMLASHCTGQEVAAYIGVHPHTLYDRCASDKGIHFSQYAQSKRFKGNSIIRMAQVKHALKGNAQMLMWLGKVLLDQKEPEATPAGRIELVVTRRGFERDAIDVTPDNAPRVIGSEEQAHITETECEEGDEE